jgi:hypothetical protein
LARQKIFLFPKVDMELTKTSVQWVAGGTETGHEFDPSHQSTAEVKIKWRHAAATPICLHGVERDKFALLLIMKSRESLEKVICSDLTRLDCLFCNHIFQYWTILFKIYPFRSFEENAEFIKCAILTSEKLNL